MIRSLLLALLLLTAAGAHAQDACLTGASTLGDQRALATLRTDTDGVCPCETAASRGSWRRCARTLLKSTVAGTTLRAECEKTAKGVIKGATCGSTRDTCGRVQPDGKTVISCRVKKAPSCTDKAKYGQTACRADALRGRRRLDGRHLLRRARPRSVPGRGPHDHDDEAVA
jgi:hypothetical protein